jgi:hypothetical protein
MTELGDYSFLPWLRHGIAGAITAADLDEAVTERASVRIDLTLRGEPGGGPAALTAPVGRDVELYGPGDVVGIDPRAIVRTEPRHWITAFEPNYLAHVEFYDEDFPWRYTPAAPDGVRLRPWIALAVLAEGEFTESADPTRPLPAISVPDATLLPPANGLWAWAHVHVNRSLAANEDEMRSTDMAAVLPRLEAVLAENADLACARIVCPRRLAENTAYHAFVVPVFESGRLAGLGLDPSAAPHATFSAWADYDGKELPSLLPVYHRWYFRTGAQQDFESLVRLLEPKPVDPRVGRRDLDVQRPGAGLPGIVDLALGGVLRLGGALRVPRVSLGQEAREEAERYDAWAEPRPHAFQVAMASLVNLADDYERLPAADANAASGVAPHPDPVVTMPLYGRWHALQKRLLRERDGTPLDPDDNWVHDLNLDPRHRVAAGFGTRVVQQNQEQYMDAAWRQVGAVLEANRRIRRAQLARELAAALHRRHLEPLLTLSAERAIALTAPVHGRVVDQGATVRHRRAESRVQPVLTSAPLRRILRTGGPVARLVSGRAKDGRLLERVARGELTPAPPKVLPRGVVALERVADELARRQGTKPAADALRERNLRPDAARRLPEPDGFSISVPTRDPRPRDATGEARRLKSAVGDWNALAEASGRSSARPPLKALDVGSVAATMVRALDPRATVPKRTLHGIKLPPWLLDLIGEEFQEAMAYPRIDLPMYEPLVALSSELFLPNLHLVEQNSITLLETHQEFIEAYMVGLNHEMARELLWREYPTDQRGSPFRQFWDVRGVLDTEGRTPDELREALYDIPELHRWRRRSDLGDHDHRERPGDTEEEVVLLIRGELLKQYPTAVIYAHKAEWQPKADGTPDLFKERVLSDLTDAEEANPPHAKVRTPLYEAKVDPDVYFFGFDLTAEEAKGGTAANPGWFFVIKERPGEPRFGLDISRSGPIQTFNDLAWPDAPGVEPGEHLPASAFGSVALQAPGSADVEKADQHAEDLDAGGAATSSARWAYVLYQAPVMVAVHAAEMLRVRS